MKLLAVLIIAVIIFVLVYFPSKRDTKKAVISAICVALAATIAFAGPYIVNIVETKEPSTGSIQENKQSDDLSTYPDKQNSSNSKEDPNQFVQPENPTHVATYPDKQNPSESEENPNQFVQSENPTHVEVMLPTPDLELSINKIATVKMEVQNIESQIIENIGAQIDVYNGSLTIEGQVDTYYFTPSITGRYRFEISGLTSGTDHKVNLVIKNSGDGVVDSTSYGITNGSGLTIKNMQADETFQIQVKQYTGLDSYTLSIGNQKETVDVTGYTVVRDSIEVNAP